jgi:hypothetical protein
MKSSCNITERGEGGIGVIDMYTFCGHTVGGRQKLGTGWALKKAFE